MGRDPRVIDLRHVGMTRERMSYTIPTNEPKEFRAGDLLTWTREDLTDYPASSWTLKYYLVKSGKQILITATADGDIFLVSVAPATTAVYEAGIYKWLARVSTGSGATLEEYTIEEGTIEVLPNLGAVLTGGLDTHSHAKKMLDALELMLQGKAPYDVLQYTINGRSLQKLLPKELEEWRNHYKAEYQNELSKEDMKAGRSPHNTVRVKFRSPS